jgi:hypothetical protein
VIGSILAATYSSHVNLAGLTSRVAAQVKHSYAVATQLPMPIPERAHIAFVEAMHIALLTAAGAATIAAIGVLLLLGRNSAAGEPLAAAGRAKQAATPQTAELA